MLKYKELYSNNLITVIESNIAPVTNIDIPKKITEHSYLF